jgi:hypothetical protein
MLMSRAQSDLERRVTALETDLARLKTQAGKPWWEQIAGTFANDPIYDAAMELGREYRRSLKPGTPQRKGKHGRPRHRSR